MAQHFLSLNPFLGGIVAGALHTLLGPDHLSSIITLSACQGIEAFWFGVRWAGGHLTGMATLGIVFTILQFRLDSTVLEMYEHGMDYLVGIMLIFFGGYFIFNAQQYFDSEWSLKPTTCACHSHLAGGYPSEHQPLIPSASSNGPVESSTGWSLKGLDVRKAGSALIGFVQGIACPGGLVGMAFLKQYTQLEIVFFFRHVLCNYNVGHGKCCYVVWSPHAEVCLILHVRIESVLRVLRPQPGIGDTLDYSHSNWQSKHYDDAWPPP